MAPGNGEIIFYDNNRICLRQIWSHFKKFFVYFDKEANTVDLMRKANINKTKSTFNFGSAAPRCKHRLTEATQNLDFYRYMGDVMQTGIIS